MPSQEAQKHQRQREDLAEAMAKTVLNEWRKVDPEHVARQWQRLLPRVTSMVQAGQFMAAQQTPEFMHSLLHDEDDGPSIVAERFAQAAPDGRPLDTLLALPAAKVEQAKRKGFGLRRAKAFGASMLDMLVRTVVADTGRQADKVAMFGNRRVTSYVRVVEMPACSRCIILAGNEYSMSTGFARHPNCDCTMEPVTRKHKPIVADPQDLYDAMSDAQRRKTFGKAGAKAIADGARLSSVVNARKGMAKIEMHGVRVHVTYTGTGSRKKKRPPRLMPEEIYRIADSREDAIRLLYKNGYLR